MRLGEGRRAVEERWLLSRTFSREEERRRTFRFSVDETLDEYDEERRLFRRRL